MALNLYEIVTARIIAALESGKAPWRKPWTAYGFPSNYFRHHTYQGINALVLNFTEYEHPFFATLHQVNEHGGSIRKGAKAEQVYFFKYLYFDRDGQKVSALDYKALREIGHHGKCKRFLQYFNVFNVADFEGIEVRLPEPPPGDGCERAAALLQNLPEQPHLIRTVKDRAFYSAVTDRINMPYERQFVSMEEYYCTFFHELTHWTGHPHRLSRFSCLPERIGTEPYAKEELVAEIGAAFLCARTGIARPEVTDNTAAYLRGWIDRLKGDNTLIFDAASDARKAAAWLCNEVTEPVEV